MAKSPTTPDKPIVPPVPPADAAGGGPAPVSRSDAELVSVAAAEPVAGLGEAAAALGAPIAPVIPVPVGGQGVGANRIAEPELGVHSQPLDARTADPRGPLAGPNTGGFRYESDLPRPTGRLVVDPDEVPGTRILEALTRILRDGRHYEPGEDIELDFRGYEELVSIGAVPPIDWRTGERVRLAPSPGAPRY